MVSALEARAIAGRKLVDIYGFSFVRDNVDKRLFTGVIDKENVYVVSFELFNDNISATDIVDNDTISNHERSFPKILLLVQVNKNTGEAVIIEE